MFAKRKQQPMTTYASGNKYEGEMKGGKRDGKGKFIWTDGTTYDGEWKANQQHGYGVLTFPNKSVFSGNFQKNNIQGMGTLLTVKDETIKGFWSFKKRMITTDGPGLPVSQYMLKVEVTTTDGITRPYDGPATLHIVSGMIVLPNMIDPNEKVDAVVAAVLPPAGKVDEEAEPIAQATPVVNTVTSAEGNTTTIKFGAHDTSYDKELIFRNAPANALDPRTYF